MKTICISNRFLLMHRLLILFILGISFSCQKPTGSDMLAKDDSTSISWLALGDSYTIGQGVNTSERFPAQTLDLLKLRSIKTAQLTYIATTGWTSAELDKSVSQQNLAYYDFVTVLIGVNDQFQGVDTSTYSKNFKSILNRAIQATRGESQHVLVMSIPDYSLTPEGKKLDTTKIKREIDLFNSLNKKLANNFKCQYLDITVLGREAKLNPTWVAKDGLHPSAVAYKNWADRIYPFIVR
jgi:lysophospholipase L1-like esterase